MTFIWGDGEQLVSKSRFDETVLIMMVCDKWYQNILAFAGMSNSFPHSTMLCSAANVYSL